AVVLEHLLQITFRYGDAFHHLSVGLLKRDFDIAHDEGQVGRVGDAKIHHSDTVAVAECAGAEFQDFALELEMGSFIRAENHHHGDRDGDEPDPEENEKLLTQPRASVLITQKAAVAMQAGDIIADRLDAGRDGDSEHQTDATPEGTPEHQRHRHHQRIQVDARAHHLRVEKIHGNQVEDRYDSGDEQIDGGPIEYQ